MNKKIQLILSLIIVLVGLAIIVTTILVSRPAVVYSDDPKDWVSRDWGKREISVDQVTKGHGFDAEEELYLEVDGTSTSFLYEGYFDEEYFKKEYMQNGRVVLRISPDMNPNDGIMEIFIAERIIDGGYKVYVFVDEDWKDRMPVTNIISGDDEAYTKSKRFIFKEISSGVYMDQIDDDPSRFMYSHRLSLTGIVVGNITLAQVQQGAADGVVAVIFQ